MKNTIPRLFIFILLSLYGCKFDSSILQNQDLQAEPNYDEPKIVNITYENQAFTITWQKSKEESFKFYKLYKSEFADMSDSMNIYFSENPIDTSYTLPQLEKNQVRYFKLAIQYSDNIVIQGIPVAASSHDRIIFTGTYQNERGLYTVDINGNWPVRLSTSGIKPYPSFDGSKIVYITEYYSSYNSILIMNSDGSEKYYIAENMSWNGFPEFNFDATKIVYVTKQNNVNLIYIMDPDGSNKIRLTEEESFDPHFSPDGSRILYHSRDNNGWDDIYLMDIDGTNKFNLTNLGVAGNPEYSPNGDQIIFTSQLSWDYELYSIKPDGTNFKNISNKLGEEADAKFSPDGNKIVFINFRGEGDDPLYIMDSDGSNIKLLSSGGSNRFPCFSPDGSKIVFRSDRAGEEKIYVINTDGSGLCCVSAKFTFPRYPAFLLVK